MVVYGVVMTDKKGKKVFGETIVSAPSEAYIKSHKSKYMGSDRYIGAIRKTKIKNFKKWEAQPRSKRFPEDYRKDNLKSQMSSVLGFSDKSITRGIPD